MSLAYQKGGRRSVMRLLVLLAVFAGLVYYCVPSIPWLPTPNDNDGDLLRKVGELRAELKEKWPWTGYATHRPATIKALDRLEYCLETGTCGEGEKTIILLGSYHFGHSQNGHTSGEDIWAASLIQIHQANNHTLLYTYETLESLLVYQALGEHIPLVIMEATGLDQCLALGQSTLAELEAMSPKIDGLQDYTEGDKLGCAKRVGFEEGIPVQKIRALHFWSDQRHPLPGFTIAPENYTSWPHESTNYYLGYHLEHCRRVEKALPHEKRAFILGKRPDYFTPEKYAWPTNVLEELSNEMGNGFEFVGAAGRAGVDEMPVKGVRNLGGMDKEKWGHEVAQSAVMLGIGNPPLSPSPYDALCLGVPFINPVLRIYNKPEDRSGWLVQHYGLKELDPPYVYHVYKEDKQALREAIESALKTPFPPYIPERMKFESVEARLLHLVHHNWTEEAEKIIAKGKVKGFARLETGENSVDGLLL